MKNRPKFGSPEYIAYIKDQIAKEEAQQCPNVADIADMYGILESLGET